MIQKMWQGIANITIINTLHGQTTINTIRQALFIGAKRKTGMPTESDSSKTISKSSSSGSDETSDFNESNSPRKRQRTSPDLAFSEETTSRVRLSKSAKPITAPSTDAPIPSTIAQAQDPASLASRTSFATIGVAPWLVASMSALAVRRPTAIQAACIPPLLRGDDVLGTSRTGSGKTIAFAAPILQLWAEDPTGIFALVLTPTRELALQIYEQFSALGASQSLKCLLVTGGADMLSQATGLSSRPHVVVATPGRLADHIRTSGAETIAGLNRVRLVILDEADRLLQPGKGSMLDDLEEVLAACPSKQKRQTAVFTATVTEQVRAIKDSSSDGGSKNSRNLFVAEVDRPASIMATASGTITTDAQNTVDHVEGGETSLVRTMPSTLLQTYLLTPVTHRESYLHVLLSTPANIARSTIIFVNRTTTAQLLEHTLRLLSHRVTSLHSLLPQRERSANLAKFRARAARILVATDVASRGLDIPDVALVVNFDVPRDPDDYVHRVGRTARAGKKGMSVTLVGQRDVELVHAIEGRVGSEMVAYDEGPEVSIEGRVVREGLKTVGEKKREAMVQIEKGLSVKGKRKHGKLRPAD